MADKTIGSLTATAGVVSTDLFEVEKLAGPPSEKATVAQLITLLNSIYGTGPFLPLAGGTMTGAILFNADNSIDIGASGATRPRTGYFAASVVTDLLASPAATALSFASAGTTRANFSTAGHLLFNTDNTNDIGASAATRPRSAYIGTNIVCGNGTAAVPSLGFTGVTNSGVRLNPTAAVTGPSLVAAGADVLTGFNGARDGVAVRSDGQIVWNNTDLNGVFAPDIGFSRNAAGIVEVNSATTGTFRDLWARIVRTTPGQTVAALPAAGLAGRRTYVTDGLGSAWGVAIAGGGAQVVPVFDNGVAWVAG